MKFFITNFFPFFCYSLHSKYEHFFLSILFSNTLCIFPLTSEIKLNSKLLKLQLIFNFKAPYWLIDGCFYNDNYDVQCRLDCDIYRLCTAVASQKPVIFQFIFIETSI
jgi:hypothetical protein